MQEKEGILQKHLVLPHFSKRLNDLPKVDGFLEERVLDLGVHFLGLI